MATLRTEEEKSAILAHCLELERTGGDILSYLWSQDYLTPRATWFNYQREWLGRKPYEFTDGKPKKGRREMSGKRIITDEIREAAVKAYFAGGSPCRILKDAGCKNPSSAWTNIKMKLEKEHPEIAAKIENGKPGPKPKKQLQLDAGADYDISVKDAMDNMQEAADTFFGQCEDMGLKVGASVQPIEDYIKEQMDQYEISAVRHRNYGEFYHDFDHNCIDWRTPEGDEVSMSVSGWKGMIGEFPRIMRLLGVEL